MQCIETLVYSTMFDVNALQFVTKIAGVTRSRVTAFLLRSLVVRLRKRRMTQAAQPLSALTRLLELCGRQMHAVNHVAGLYPAQWSVLRYLAVMPDEQRTSASLARYQQLAFGAVTRTVRTLIIKELVSKGPSTAHHRAERLDLTEKGRTLLQLDPLVPVDVALKDLDANERDSAYRVLSLAMLALQAPKPR
jgi:DNA-binding MarR family transcriptional regulator